MPKGGLFQQEEERGIERRERSGIGPGQAMEPPDRRRVTAGVASITGLLCIVLLAGTVMAEPWAQAGYDAERTFSTPDDAPDLPEVAFQVELPGSTWMQWALSPAPLIQDGDAYVSVRSVDDTARTLELDGVVRVNLTTAQVDRFVELEGEGQAGPIAIDDTYLFLVTRTSLNAYRLSDGDLAWSEPHPKVFPEAVDESTLVCAQPVLREGSIVYSCTVSDSQNVVRWDSFVVEREVSDGEARDVWTTQEMATSPQAESSGEYHHILLGVSALGERVTASMISVREIPVCPLGNCLGSVAQLEIGIHALGYEGEELTYRWGKTDTFRASFLPDEAGENIPQFTDFRGLSVLPTGDGGEIYARVQEKVISLTNRATEPPERWNATIGEEDVDPSTMPQTGGPFNTFALGPEEVYTFSSETLYRFDRTTGANPWQVTLDPELDQRFTNSGIVLADDTIYAAGTSREGNGTTIYAVDTTNGGIHWRQPLPTNQTMGNTAPFRGDEVPHRHSVGEGVLVAAGRDASFWVLGETEASIEPVAISSHERPGVEEEVTVDLAGTEPGAFGHATRFRADWGDGTATDWQENPVLTHSYEEEGEVTARFWVANGENQTASTTETFNVGAVEPNWVSERFEPENQDMTFGVIGVALALGGSLVTVGRRYRKRSNLEAELKALEEGFEETKENPGECEAFLDNRKGRARSLAIDGHLEEDQVGIIENRADELRGQLRFGMLDARFQFLPHGMVQSLKRMLADGKINAWERDTIEDLLERDEALNYAQKERVRGLLERWSTTNGGPEEGG